jgi:hypothetical protein
MTVPGNLSSPLLATAAAAAAAAGVATKSLRFNNADSANLSRTFASAGNRKTWTWAGWVKRSAFGTGKYGLFGGSGINSMIRFNNDNGGDQLRVLDSATGGYDLITERKFRDTSWYHIAVAIDTTQSTSADRVKIYVNGVEETSFASSSYPTQNAELTFNNNISHTVGTAIGSIAFDGYLADVFFCDGLAISPVDNFIELDDNGVYQAKEYSGTFGTNGFRLAFSDATNTTTIAEDSSGNNNDFTANNISVTAGAGNDSLFDVPTNGSQSDTGAGGEVSGNYATFNPLSSQGGTLSNGNLNYTGTSNNFATIGVTAGKWYWEITNTGTLDNVNNTFLVGVASDMQDSGTFTSKVQFYSQASQSAIYRNSGSAVETLSGTTLANGDVLGVALDLDSGTQAIQFYKNGSTVGSSTALNDDGKTWTPSAKNAPASIVINFGQRAFAYSAPSGYKALCTTNLPTPTIADGSAYFDAKLWTGNATDNRDITGYEFSPDLVWIKERSSTGDHHLFDIVRGATKAMRSNNTDAEVTDANELKAFNSDGFRLGTGGDVNASGTATVGWAWDAGTSTVTNNVGDITTSLRANPTAGFSIATYSGSGTSGDTLGHGLNAEPEFVIIKSRTKVDDWRIYHKGVGTGHYLRLNDTHAKTTTNNWQSVSNTTFGIDSDTAVNSSSHTYVAYFFAPVAGFSHFTTFEGTGSSDPVFVYCGFRPAFILRKNADSDKNWYLHDTARDTFNVCTKEFQPHNSSAEGDHDAMDILSNGFAMRTSNAQHNNSGDTHIVIAFAENPFQVNGGLAR